MQTNNSINSILLKKKRYKKHTIGRLQLFFQKEPYIGTIKFYKPQIISLSTLILTPSSTKLNHYSLYC